jgi:hypothetical protein
VALVALPIGYYVRRPRLPQPVPASGIVTLDGVPLDAAEVVFVPIDPNGKAAAGTTSTVTGAFSLKSTLGTTIKNGVLPGSYTVVVSKRKIIPSGNPPRDAHTGREIILGPGEEWSGAVLNDDIVEHISPIRYTAPATSGLTAEVTKDGPNSYVFNLTTN